MDTEPSYKLNMPDLIDVVRQTFDEQGAFYGPLFHMETRDGKMMLLVDGWEDEEDKYRTLMKYRVVAIAEDVVAYAVISESWYVEGVGKDELAEFTKQKLSPAQSDKRREGVSIALMREDGMRGFCLMEIIREEGQPPRLANPKPDMLEMHGPENGDEVEINGQMCSLLPPRRPRDDEMHKARLLLDSLGYVAEDVSMEEDHVKH